MPFGISFGIGPFRFYSRRRSRRRGPQRNPVLRAQAKHLSSRYNRARVALMKARPDQAVRLRAEFEQARLELNQFSAAHPGYVRKVKAAQF